MMSLKSNKSSQDSVYDSVPSSDNEEVKVLWKTTRPQKGVWPLNTQYMYN